MKFNNFAASLLLIALFCSGHRVNAQVGQDDSRATTPERTDSLLSSEPIKTRLKLAGNNRAELERAIENVDPQQREGLSFLLLHMPEYDLKNLKADFLISNIKLAYRAREKANWKIPDDVFFNDVLPYANIDEPRDPWRKKFFEMCWPIVQECKTPTEAAQKLNQTIFGELSVKYSTARKRANQSPQESIDQGLASCTGLSIILTDACRSVGVPARLAGIPSWKNKRGNHTWVEIWDEGWHFTGAAEYNPQGLNRTWFQGDAALADPQSKLHSIYAVSFRKTNIDFPMVWSPEKRVYATNVTTRYLADQPTPPKKDSVNVMIRIWNQDKSERKILNVVVIEDGKPSQKVSGRTKGGTADMNDMLTFALKPKTGYEVRVSPSENADQTIAVFKIATSKQANQLKEFLLDEDSAASNLDRDEDKLMQNKPVALPVNEPLISAADKFCWKAAPSPERFDRGSLSAIRQLVWDRYLKSVMPLRQQADFEIKINLEE